MGALTCQRTSQQTQKTQRRIAGLLVLSLEWRLIVQSALASAQERRLFRRTDGTGFEPKLQPDLPTGPQLCQGRREPGVASVQTAAGPQLLHTAPQLLLKGLVLPGDPLQKSPHGHSQLPLLRSVLTFTQPDSVDFTRFECQDQQAGAEAVPARDLFSGGQQERAWRVRSA